MADIDSNLPIFSRSTSAPVIVSKDTSANALANPLAFQLSDGTSAVGITSGALDVNVTTASVTVDASDLDIRDLTAASDSVAIKNGSNQLAIDASGYVTANINGTVTVSASDFDIRDLTHASDSVKIGDGTEFLAIDASNNAMVNINGQSLTALKVSKDANANAETNPIFVQVVDGAVSGVEVLSYDTSSAVAVDATDNHDYAVNTGKTLKVKRCFGSASGAQKIEVQAGPVATLVSKAVLFTSMANPNWEVNFEGLLEVPDASTGTVRIIRKNRDEAAMDVYSTLIGVEV